MVHFVNSVVCICSYLKSFKFLWPIILKVSLYTHPSNIQVGLINYCPSFYCSIYRNYRVSFHIHEGIHFRLHAYLVFTLYLWILPASCLILLLLEMDVAIWSFPVFAELCLCCHMNMTECLITSYKARNCYVHRKIVKWLCCLPVRWLPAYLICVVSYSDLYVVCQWRPSLVDSFFFYVFHIV